MKTLLLIILFSLSATFVQADTSPFPDENIHIKADTMNHGDSEGIFTATGNVYVTWQGLILSSDRANYDSGTRMLHATGNVVVEKGSEVLKGDSLSLNLENGRGEMTNASLSAPDSSLSVTGEKIVRLNDNELEVSNTDMTTCELPNPDWKFGADRLKVNVLGYATGRNILFYIRDLPVFYLPWVAFPVVREKKSGLLFPRFGYSNTRGAQLVLPLYWVINPSQDLLVDLDLMAKRGVGTGVDYRYRRSRGSEGHAGGYQIYDLVEKRWRWQIGQSHREIFSKDLNLRTDVNLYGDRSFLRVFGEKSGEYNRQSSDTTLNLLKTWQNYSMMAHLRYVEDLYAVDNSSTIQTLPEIGMAGVRQRILNVPLFFDMDVALSNLYRESSYSGQRLLAFPRVTLLNSYGGYINTSLFAGVRAGGYRTDLTKASGGIQQNEGVLVPEAGVRLSTSLSRVYQLEGEHLRKLKHEIVPEIFYSYIPSRSQQHLPFYDHSDRHIWQNMVYLSLTSMLDGKFASKETSEYRDISRIRLMMGYSFEGGRRDLLTTVDTGRPLSHLLMESETWLHKLVKLTFDSRYNPYDGRIDSSTAGIEFDDRVGNIVGAAYRMARNDVEYFEGRLSTKLIKPMTLSYSSRFSFDRGEFLESVYSAEYREKCWSLNLALHDRPGNQSFTFNFNLLGLTGR